MKMAYKFGSQELQEQARSAGGESPFKKWKKRDAPLSKTGVWIGPWTEDVFFIGQIFLPYFDHEEGKQKFTVYRCNEPDGNLRACSRKTFSPVEDPVLKLRHDLIMSDLPSDLAVYAIGSDVFTLRDLRREEGGYFQKNMLPQLRYVFRAISHDDGIMYLYSEPPTVMDSLQDVANGRIEIKGDKAHFSKRPLLANIVCKKEQKRTNYSAQFVSDEKEDWPEAFLATAKAKDNWPDPAAFAKKTLDYQGIRTYFIEGMERAKMDSKKVLSVLKAKSVTEYVDRFMSLDKLPKEEEVGFDDVGDEPWDKESGDDEPPWETSEKPKVEEKKEEDGVPWE
jgi:hypothetical protein